jgi:hypothetical protein
VKECHLFASVGAATDPKEALERITCLSHFIRCRMSQFDGGFN